MKRLLTMILICAIGMAGCGKKEMTVTEKAVFSEVVSVYREMDYGTYRKQTGNKAEFYNGMYFTGEIPDSKIAIVYKGRYDEEAAESVLDDEALPARFQGELGELLLETGEETSLEELTERLSFVQGTKAVCEVLEGAGTAYYVGNVYVQIQSDSDGDGEIDLILEVNLDDEEKGKISSDAPAWLILPER